MYIYGESEGEYIYIYIYVFIAISIAMDMSTEIFKYMLNMKEIHVYTYMYIYRERGLSKFEYILRNRYTPLSSEHNSKPWFSELRAQNSGFRAQSSDDLNKTFDGQIISVYLTGQISCQNAGAKMTLFEFDKHFAYQMTIPVAMLRSENAFGLSNGQVSLYFQVCSSDSLSNPHLH